MRIVQKPYPRLLFPFLRKILHGGLYWILTKMSKMVEERMVKKEPSPEGRKGSKDQL